MNFCSSEDSNDLSINAASLVQTDRKYFEF